ncbi:hypothetical protein TSAR_011488 [Trichomalopsis sarcophagae]|uniref:Uncharacterized protein n=1 Tax=Trichomalopsis sarcophagae TaxID=543379 RepID=A0A232EKN2_9HYME|nr:hypothetical protein TSAR_011488 [Trichomalopsis sarcophagae]
MRTHFSHKVLPVLSASQYATVVVQFLSNSITLNFNQNSEYHQLLITLLNYQNLIQMSFQLDSPALIDY